MPSRFSILFFFFSITQLFAREVSISVLAPGYAEKKISIWLQDDLFAGHRTLLESKTIEDEAVVFRIDVSEVSLLRLTLDYQYALMLVRPGSSYRVEFPLPDDRGQLSMAGNTRVQLLFEALDSTDINYKISGFNTFIDRFVYENISGENPPADSLNDDESPAVNENEAFAVNRFSERELLLKLEALRMRTDSLYSDEDAYFNTYRRFVFANLEFGLGKKRRKLYFDYLSDSGVYYHNAEFVRFFKAFYDDFFDFYSYYPYAEKLISAFESDQPAAALLSIIKGDTLTGSPEMQRLVLLNGLFDLYPNTSRWKDRIVEILKMEKQNNPYPGQRLIAGYLVDNLLKGKKGSDVPALTYTGANGDTLQLSELKGKMVYIQFFATWNTSALAEMELMVDLKKRYGHLVDFLSVSIDEDVAVFQSFVKENARFKWNFGWIGADPGLWYQFEINHLPLFYLIDAEGKIISWPALLPSTGIESVFYKEKYSRKSKKKKSYWNTPSNKSNNDG